MIPKGTVLFGSIFLDMKTIFTLISFLKWKLLKNATKQNRPL